MDIPIAVAVDPQTNFIYVAIFGNSQGGNPGNITVIDGATHATSMLTDPKAIGPIAVAANSVTNMVYVANSGSNNVTVIDARSSDGTSVRSAYCGRPTRRSRSLNLGSERRVWIASEK